MPLPSNFLSDNPATMVAEMEARRAEYEAYFAERTPHGRLKALEEAVAEARAAEPAPAPAPSA